MPEQPSRAALAATVAVAAVAVSVALLLRRNRLAKLAQGLDQFSYLEEVTSDRALHYVRTQNERVIKVLGDPKADPTYSRILGILDSKDKIPFAALRGPGRYMNLWKDEQHPRGLWRRLSTLEEMANVDAKWETVFDLDALDAQEGKPGWVWKGYTPLEEGELVPRCLLKISRGGADAVEVREFDMDKKEFVPKDEAFFVPEAKTSVSYKGRNSLLIGSDFGPGSLTSSGYPRVIKEWTRGQQLSAAPVVFEGQESDVSVSSWFEPNNRGFQYEWRVRSMTFYTSEHYVRALPDLDFVKLPTPEDAEVQTFADQLLIQLRSDYSANGKQYLAGSLLACDLRRLCKGNAEFIVLFEPTKSASLEYFAAGKTVLLLSVLEDVKSKLVRYVYSASKWTRVDAVPIPEGGEFAKLDVWAHNDQFDDCFWLTATSFLLPTTLFVLDASPANRAPPRRIRGLPSQFDASGLQVAQHFATSLDGTRVPYFEVSKTSSEAAAGPRPTLLYAYGGFEISMLPRYSAVVGVSWLEMGGTYLMANIRGGGEYGPTWHQAALREKRHKAFEDLEAVAQHAISRGACTASSLGVMGGSNGGLLVGNAFVRAPQTRLWGAIVCEVPLLDMRRFNKLLAGASWMAEYGDPDDPEQWKWLQGFSPYHQLQKGAQYPPILFTTSTRDDRVHPGHARKMSAKLIETGYEATTLSYENIEGGHGGAADNKQLAYLEVLAFSFLRQRLGLAKV